MSGISSGIRVAFWNAQIDRNINTATMSGFSPVARAMAIAPKCTGFLSLCASTFIVQHVLRDKKRRGLTYHRLLCGMSISDMVGSFMCFLSTWPIPKGEAYLASGTVQTCAAQGFCK